ncbi:hypothetical protein M419DRAFT_36996 [Trichoderma reesei RUT C-30]|jgi:hypothetical protein|uniref:Uncharacterized protein n=1 Tax=Hypocrea jecorina (strain ATCC 56765 / BCRC 32924 / NRRL 11460 / Rut C-30) TaxID=1344414 RepID=A0A024S6N3_HYPJR|nr:hypothetical protein M419DRAFT_36996 [Trichoderma reesei RUT C-30]
MADFFRMNLQPAPHPVVQAADFPRVHAENFPHGDRAAFSKYYPTGIPVTYKMMHGVHSQGVAQTYLEDHLPVGFYTAVPPKARAFISTSNGTRPFRKLDHILPQRRVHLWSKDEIQIICNSLRKLYWNEFKDMQQPHCWDDLWTYFDAHDLYHNGCMNLWNVINTIWDENKIIAVDVSREIAAHIGHWADDWLKREENKEKLVRWEESHGPIFRILDDRDHESLGLIQDDVVPLIASALKSRRTFLLSGREAGHVEEPAALVAACCTNKIENWLSEFLRDDPVALQKLIHPSIAAGQRVLDNNGLPSPPVAEPHRGSLSLNGPAPCLVENGKHYYLTQHSLPPPEPPTRPIEALQALQKSAIGAAVFRPAEAAKTGIVIANGSNMPKRLQMAVEKADPKTSSEDQSQSDPRRSASMPETSSPVAGSSMQPRRNEVLLGAGNELAADAEVRRSSESACLPDRGKSSPGHSSLAKHSGAETMMDKLTRDVADLEHTEKGFKGMNHTYGERATLPPAHSHFYQPRPIERPD